MKHFINFFLKISILTACTIILQIESGTAQIRISANGNWNPSITSADLLEAGSDLAPNHASSNSQTLLNIYQQSWFYDLFFSYNWRVDVRKTDINWDNSLDLYIRRTGKGTIRFRNGNISGGLNYQQLTNTNQVFFNGTRARLDVPIQYELRNISVLLPAQTYSTIVIYTVTEL